jgi:hypothetical protein
MLFSSFSKIVSPKSKQIVNEQKKQHDPLVYYLFTFLCHTPLYKHKGYQMQIGKKELMRIAQTLVDASFTSESVVNVATNGADQVSVTFFVSKTDYDNFTMYIYDHTDDIESGDVVSRAMDLMQDKTKHYEIEKWYYNEVQGFKGTEREMK